MFKGVAFSSGEGYEKFLLSAFLYYINSLQYICTSFIIRPKKSPHTKKHVIFEESRISEVTVTLCCLSFLWFWPRALWTYEHKPMKGLFSAIQHDYSQSDDSQTFVLVQGQSTHTPAHSYTEHSWRAVCLSLFWVCHPAAASRKSNLSLRGVVQAARQYCAIE